MFTSFIVSELVNDPKIIETGCWSDDDSDCDSDCDVNNNSSSSICSDKEEEAGNDKMNNVCRKDHNESESQWLLFKHKLLRKIAAIIKSTTSVLPIHQLFSSTYFEPPPLRRSTL